MERPLVRNRDIISIPDAVTTGTEHVAPRGDSRSHADRCPERPGGNVTGQSFHGLDIGVRGLDLLMEVSLEPGVSQHFTARKFRGVPGSMPWVRRRSRKA